MIVFVVEIRRKWSRENHDERSLCSRRRRVGREADRFGSRCSRRRRHVGASGSRGRRAGPAVQSRSGHLESGDDDGETGRVIQNLWFRVFFSYVLVLQCKTTSFCIDNLFLKKMLNDVVL